MSECYQRVNDGSGKQTGFEVSTLKIASKQLERLAKHPNKTKPVGRICATAAFRLSLIGTAIGTLALQPLDIDFMVFHGEGYKLPKPNGNFFARLWFDLKSLFIRLDQRTKIISRRTTNPWKSAAANPLVYQYLQDIIDSNLRRNQISRQIAYFAEQPKACFEQCHQNQLICFGHRFLGAVYFALRGMSKI